MAAKLLHGKVCLVTGDHTQTCCQAPQSPSQTDAVFNLQGGAEALAKYACLMHMRHAWRHAVTLPQGPIDARMSECKGLQPDCHAYTHVDQAA